MPNILIVEDEEAIRRVLKKVLIEDDSKNNIIEATDGSDAINKIKSENLELVICDIKMPKKDGIDVLNYLVDKPVVLSVDATFSGFFDDLKNVEPLPVNGPHPAGNVSVHK